MFDSVLSCGLSGLFERYPAGSLDVKLSERSLRMILLGSRALVPAGVFLSAGSFFVTSFLWKCRYLDLSISFPFYSDVRFAS